MSSSFGDGERSNVLRKIRELRIENNRGLYFACIRFYFICL